MRARTLGAAALLPILAFAMAGCMQFGEYAMGGECEALSEDVASAVQEINGAEPDVEELWAGEAEDSSVSRSEPMSTVNRHQRSGPESG